MLPNASYQGASTGYNSTFVEFYKYSMHVGNTEYELYGKLHQPDAEEDTLPETFSTARFRSAIEALRWR